MYFFFKVHLYHPFSFIGCMLFLCLLLLARGGNWVGFGLAGRGLAGWRVRKTNPNTTHINIRVGGLVGNPDTTRVTRLIIRVGGLAGQFRVGGLYMGWRVINGLAGHGLAGHMRVGGSFSAYFLFLLKIINIKIYVYIYIRVGGSTREPN